MEDYYEDFECCFDNREVYHRVPLYQTHKKLRALELLAGLPRVKRTRKSGWLGTGVSKEAQRRMDHDMARLAQAQYEEIVRNFQPKNPD